jgi:hypothetical protein
VAVGREVHRRHGMTATITKFAITMEASPATAGGGATRRRNGMRGVRSRASGVESASSAAAIRRGSGRRSTSIAGPTTELLSQFDVHDIETTVRTLQAISRRATEESAS